MNVIIEDIRSIKSDQKELRKFGLTVGIVLCLLGILLFFKERPFQVISGIGLLLVLLSLTIPKLLLPFQKIWMGLAIVLGFLMTRVILTILFYIIMTPVGLVSRLFGKRFLELSFKDSKSSYWIERKPGDIDPQKYERQF